MTPGSKVSCQTRPRSYVWTQIRREFSATTEQITQQVPPFGSRISDHQLGGNQPSSSYSIFLKEFLFYYYQRVETRHGPSAHGRRNSPIAVVLCWAHNPVRGNLASTYTCAIGNPQEGACTESSCDERGVR